MGMKTHIKFKKKINIGYMVFLGPRANAGMVPVIFFSKLPLHASHVALP
jgi:hypothetical protein